MVVFVDDCLCTFPTDDRSVNDYKAFVRDIASEFELSPDDDGMNDACAFCGCNIEWAPWVRGERKWARISSPRAVNNVLRRRALDRPTPPTALNGRA